MTTAAGDTAGIVRNGCGEVVERSMRAEGLLVLGAWVVVTHRSAREIRERERRAERGLFAVGEFLEDNRLALRLRYHMFRQVAEPAMLCAAGCWTLTRRDRSLGAEAYNIVSSHVPLRATAGRGCGGVHETITPVWGSLLEGVSLCRDGGHLAKHNGGERRTGARHSMTAS